MAATEVQKYDDGAVLLSTGEIRLPNGKMLIGGNKYFDYQSQQAHPIGVPTASRTVTTASGQTLTGEAAQNYGQLSGVANRSVTLPNGQTLTGDTAMNYGKKPSGPPTPVTTLSSQNGQQYVNENIQKLQQMQSSYAGPSIVDYMNSIGQDSSYGARAKVAGDAGIQNYTGTAEQNTQLLNLLRAPAGNPALAGATQQINQLMQSGKATPEQQKAYNNTISIQDGLVSAISAAQNAMQSGDYNSMDFFIQRADAMERALTDSISQLTDDMRPLRESYIASLTPGAKEQELAQQANQLKGEIEQFKIQTEKNKFEEYAGQTQNFAAGRASEMDIRANFDLMMMNSNLSVILGELGLEQEARQGMREGLETQMDWLTNDFELIQKTQDRLTQMEDNLFEKAQGMRDDSRQMLGTLVDMLQGVNPDEIPYQSRNQLQQIAAQAGVPFDILMQALKTQFQQQTFDNALKTSQETRLSSGGSGGKSAGTLEERQANAVASFSSVFVPGATLPNGIPVFDSDGYLTPEAWKAAISDAPSEGLSREAFIKAFGHLITTPDGKVSTKYGLTTQEKTLLGIK